MAASQWLRRPGHLPVAFLVVTLLPACALGVLGWRLFQQDGALERRHVQDRLELAADAASESGRASTRRSLLLAGLAMWSLPVLGGAALVWRTTARELAVAELQSGFVSAVSHEFRTPLTSLRHLTELPEGRGRTGLADVRAIHLDWSPDGRTVAFVGVEGGDEELWLMEDFIHLVKPRR